MRLENPELPYLEVFDAVCTEGTFTAAARKLGCTQPAVSYQIATLEEAVGRKLLERGGGRAIPTRAGRRLRDSCRRLFAELRRARSEMAEEEFAEPLVLGSASGFGRYVLVPALVELRESSGGEPLELELRFDDADRVLDRLERAESDAAFVYSRRVSARLRHRPVYEEELVLVAPPGFRGSLEPDALDSVDEFREHPFVTYDEGDYVFGRWFDENFDRQPEGLSGPCHFNELEEVVRFVELGGGLSIVPRDAVEESHSAGRIEILYGGRGRPCLNQVYLVTRSGSPRSEQLERLAAMISARSESRR